LSNIVEDTHTIDGKTFNVEYFQTEINRAEVDFCQRPFLSPKPIEIKDDIDLSKIQYIQSSEKYKKDLEDKLCKQYVNIIWPSQGQKKLELHCTLTKTVENHHGLAKFWRKETERAFSDFLEAISVRIIELQEDVQEDIMAFLKEFTVKEPSKVALICNRNKMNLHVVGEKYDVHMLEQTIISEMKEQKSFELVMNIEHQIEMNVLVTTNIKSMFESEFENINVKLVREENKIVLHGRKSSVRNAADRLKEIRGNLKRTYIEHLEEPFTELYMSENVMRFIQERLSAKDIIASWTVRNGMLEICCNGPHKISECKEIIQNSVIRKMKVVPSPVPNLHSDKWRRTVEDLHSKYKGKIRIKLAGNATKIYIYATEDLERPASEDVTHFLETNKVIIKTYKTFQLQMRFFKKHLKSAIEEISKQFDVRIEIDHKNFYRIQGLQVDVNEAATNIKDMFDKCWQTKETFEMIGIKLYIGRMKDSINLVENKCQCVIGTEDDLPLHCVDNNDTKELSMRTEESRSDRIGSFESSLFAQEKISRSMDTSICYKNRNSYKQQIVNGAKIFAKCLVFENIHIIVCHGDITNLKVDVIARETDDNLDFSGTLGRTIIQKGGQAVKDECLRLVQTQKLSLQNTSTVFSSAGSMKAKFICHIRIQKWSQAGEKHLESSVLQCISQSSERQANSLAFPALGCGMNGFPAHVSASVIVRTIKRSFQETQNSSVTEIYFCDVRKENVQNFTKALCEEFGKRNVDVEDGDSGMDFTDYTTSLNEELRTVKLPNIQASQGPFVREIKFGGICVCVKGGTIVNEKVDVLVNTTSNSLNLKGGAVSTSVLQKGGLELQQQLHKTYPKGIKFGEVAVSDGTNLPCSIVLHTALEKWDDKNFGKCIKVCTNIALYKHALF
ncbi:protein mono-ADP-ribosyltransferase PARP14-like, partial [Mercenaria mercenaria]|uniref:protein mono-ADP-ribosyltransferase PARP14-like n=1 Tax=Mercenaria mercenaria TaxID=6596 RepID=UPI00234E50A2